MRKQELTGIFWKSRTWADERVRSLKALDTSINLYNSDSIRVIKQSWLQFGQDLITRLIVEQLVFTVVVQLPKFSFIPWNRSSDQVCEYLMNTEHLTLLKPTKKLFLQTFHTLNKLLCWYKHISYYANWDVWLLCSHSDTGGTDNEVGKNTDDHSKRILSVSLLTHKQNVAIN